MAPQGRSRLPKSVPLGVPLGVMRDGWGLYRVTVALQSCALIQSHTPHPLTVAPSVTPSTHTTHFIPSHALHDS